jgi:hypothetical protein
MANQQLPRPGRPFLVAQSIQALPAGPLLNLGIR